jgi:hypothetical protein
MPVNFCGLGPHNATGVYSSVSRESPLTLLALHIITLVIVSFTILLKTHV